ncbi:MAG: LapA family protein [Cycloclasticus sp.]
MKLLYLLLFLIVLVFGFVLSILNSAPVKINFYYGWLEMPLSFALLAAFILGVLIGLSSKIRSNLVLRHRYSKLSKEADIAKSEVSSLRTYPAKQIN